jgi:hypothetical protein
VPSGANETVVPRGKRAVRVVSPASLEYIRKRSEGGTRTAQLRSW